METWRVVADVDFLGGNLALDFIETIGGPLEDLHEDEHEFLRSYEDLVEFGLKTGTLSERSARRLRRLAPRAPGGRRGASLRRRADGARSSRPPSGRSRREGARPAPVLAELRDFAAEAIAHGELVAADDGFRWSWDRSEGLETPLWPVGHAALELMLNGPLDRIKTCGRCRWLFLDTTKNHSRRWCSTEGCGTDAKKERYVARRRARRAGSSSG